MEIKELLKQSPEACKMIYFSGFDDGRSYEREILERCVFGDDELDRVNDEIARRTGA